MDFIEAFMEALQEEIQDKYRVKPMPVGKIITVSKNDIERCTRAGSLK